MVNPGSASRRHERKFAVEGLSVVEVELVVRSHPAIFREIFHRRVVNNIYLDSPDLASLGANLHSEPVRCKTRVRWYGDTLGTIEKPVLERKLKHSHVGAKESYPLAPFELRPGFGVREMNDLFARSSLPAATRARLAPLRPVLANRYRRRYFRSADGRFRITVDSGMQGCALRSLDNRFVAWQDRGGLVVIELKYDEEHDDAAAEIAHHLPARLSRSSKYVDSLRLSFA